VLPLRFLDPDKPTFDKYGGHYHLRIESTKDLQRLLDLADGRWMATSCPLSGLNVDATFLKFLDADGNGRIISTEVRSAIRWIHKVLIPSDSWLQNKFSLSLDLINISDPEAKMLRDTATMALKNLNLEDSQELTLDQVRNRQKIMAQADYNGDGVIPPEVVKDADALQFVKDILSTIEGVADVSGLKGINEAILNQFLAETKSYLEWHDKWLIPEGQTETDIMPYGADTPNMSAAVAKVRDKIEQFFAQCSFIRYKKLFSKEVSLDKSTPDEIDYNDRNAILEYMSHAPIAKPNPEGSLPLDIGINDIYLVQTIALRDQVVKKIFGEDTSMLNEQQWRQILAKFAAYETWMKAKPSVSIEKLGVDKIKAYSGSPCVQTIRDLITIDKALADEVQQMQNLEKLLLYHQWLFEFVNNYASFPHLFSIDQKAMFEMGTLILAGREFIFSIKVENIPSHANLAKNSGICLIYLHVTGSRPEEAFDIAVPVTRGGTSELYVGKRGVFFSKSGKEFDAQIVQIVENPISLWESLKEPFRKVFSMIGARFAQISSSIQKESEKAISATTTDQTAIQKGITEVRQQPTPSQQQAPAPTPTPASQPAAQEATKTSGSTRDVMIGVGFLAAGLGTALKFLADTAKQLTQPETLRMLLIMIGIFLAISIILTAVSALLKLHRRNLGVLLQASGWAINGKMRLIRPMARFFCRKVKVPKGSYKQRKELLNPIERLARKIKDDSEEITT